MGSTKMKGFRKGLRFISQIFDDENEQEMQIGLPTDVKHVAHIGWDGDGPSIDSPSWMKEFTAAPEGVHSAPLDRSGNPIENPEVKWGSQDFSSLKIMNSPARDLPELPKSSRRHSADNSLTAESPDGDSCTKPRNSRRHQSKDSSEGSGRSRDSCTKPRNSRRHQRKDSSEGGSTSSRLSQDQSNGDLESPPSSTSKKTPGIPKKSRRKKSKDDSTDGSKASIPPPTYTSPFSDPGPETTSNILGSPNNELFQTSGG